MAIAWWSTRERTAARQSIISMCICSAGGRSVGPQDRSPLAPLRVQQKGRPGQGAPFLCNNIASLTLAAAYCLLLLPCRSGAASWAGFVKKQNAA